MRIRSSPVYGVKLDFMMDSQKSLTFNEDDSRVIFDKMSVISALYAEFLSRAPIISRA